MKNLNYYLLLTISALICLIGCQQIETSAGTLISDADALQEAISSAEPGDVITIANGTYTDFEIKFYGVGTEDSPITLEAETPGKVFIEGQSYLHLGGEYLVVEGLHFRNGYTPTSTVIRYQIGKDSTAFNSRITECVIEDYSQANRKVKDRWVEFYGQHNQMDHCYITGKSNDGATLMVYHKGNQHTNNYHQIVHNYFGPRPRKGGPRAETMRLGGSETSMTPGRANISHNYFEACNGEVEIISDKTNFNTFTNNIFYKCEGSLVMRHSNYTTVNGNIFIGDDDSDFYGGIRAVNTGHLITNNYFYKIRGEQFRSPLAMMNGIPKSSLNRYKQVTDVIVAHNTWVDCKSPIQVGVGQNKASVDVLPKSEIRSAPPIRCTVANNLIYNTKEDESPVVNHDDISGILFKENVIDNGGTEYTKYGKMRNASIKMRTINEWLYAPEAGQGEVLDSVFAGFGFEEKIKEDLFGGSRSKNNQVGAVNQLVAAEKFKIDKSKFGPSWYSTSKEIIQANMIVASSAKGELRDKISNAKSGDIIELSDPEYTIEKSLMIDKEITIRSNGKQKAQLLFKGAAHTPLFELNPKGSIKLEHISMQGTSTQLAFAPLSENMSSSYKLSFKDCLIEDFAYLLKASEGSFADSIYISNTTMQNCENGFILAAEEKGDYNAEMITIKESNFNNIKQNVIHFYRGGYDESTIGGFLTLTNNSFTKCGAKEKSGVLIKTRGIINVLIHDNTFQNNPVKLVALLWGEKNNHHSNNTIQHSGKIKVEEQQKLELIY